MPFKCKIIWKMYFEEFIFSPFWTYTYLFNVKTVHLLPVTKGQSKCWQLLTLGTKGSLRNWCIGQRKSYLRLLIIRDMVIRKYTCNTFIKKAKSIFREKIKLHLPFPPHLPSDRNCCNDTTLLQEMCMYSIDRYQVKQLLSLSSFSFLSCSA